MPECDYCGATVDEDDYHDHLRTEHYDELGRIDRRRVGAHEDDDGGLPTGPIALVAVIGLTVAIVVYLLFFAGSGGSGAADDGAATGDLPESGDPALLEDVEQYPSEGTAHVSEGTDVNYETTPPTSGPHYSSTAAAGFYEETPQLGRIVHSLEHGAVVIYYDPAALDADAREHLQALANEYTGTWSSVIVAPHPADDPDSAYVLTAWRHKLEMDEYDRDVVRAFLAEYLGRGPENPVR